MNPQELKKNLDSEAYKELKDFLLEKLAELKSIDNLENCQTPTSQAIELKAQKKAFEKLKDILDELMTIEDSNIEKKEKDQYHIL